MRTGQKSSERLLKEKVDEILDKSNHWLEALGNLATAGIIYKVERNKKGQPKGAVLVFAEDSKVQLLSSRLNRENSFKGLQMRFGPFPKNYSQSIVPISVPPASAQTAPEITPYAAKKALQTIIGDAVKEKTGWTTLEQRLSAQNYMLTPSGGSFVITFNGGKDKLKLSEIDRAFSKKKLDIAFENAPVSVEQPVSEINLEAVVMQSKPTAKAASNTKAFARSSYYERMLNMSKKTRNKRSFIIKKSLYHADVDSQKTITETLKQNFNNYSMEEYNYEY